MDPLDRSLLWPCAEFLANYIKQYDLSAYSVLELGAGIGLPSAACNSHRKDTHDISNIRDVGDVSDVINSPQDRLQVTHKWSFRWGDVIDNIEPYDVILASDIMYDSTMYNDIFITFMQFFKANPKTFIIIAYQHRLTDDTFKEFIDFYNLEVKVLEKSNDLYIFSICQGFEPFLQ